MLLSQSFIAQLHFLHFHLLFFSDYSVVTVFIVICPSPHWHFFGQLLLVSPVIYLPTPSQFSSHSYFIHICSTILPHPVQHSPPMPRPPFINRGQKHFYLKTAVQARQDESCSGVLSLLINYRSLTRTDQMLNLQRVKCK